MKCYDFEEIINERLDERLSVLNEWSSDLEAHAAICPACRAMAGRYQVLQQSLDACHAPPVPSSAMASRILIAERDSRGSRFTRIRNIAGAVALAASLLISAIVVWRTGRVKTDQPAESAAISANDSRLLGEALSRVGSATWELARETSEPAARVGREFFHSATLSETSSTISLVVPKPPVSEVLRRVGDRVQAEVEPLSGTARQAFGFFLGPPTDKPPA
jgi:hypothetical protein